MKRNMYPILNRDILELYPNLRLDYTTYKTYISYFPLLKCHDYVIPIYLLNECLDFLLVGYNPKDNVNFQIQYLL